MASMKTGLRPALLAAVAVAMIALWNTALVAQGAAGLYKAKCAACHGATGKGDTPMGKKIGVRDFASPETQKLSDGKLTAIIADGKDKMPGYKKSLKPEQIKELVEHIRSVTTKDK